MSTDSITHDARNRGVTATDVVGDGALTRRDAALALTAILLLAFGLRLWGLGRASLWSDEAFTYWWTQVPLATLWGPRAALETNPPLYYTVAWAAQHLLGSGEWALRLPSALFGTAGVAVVFFLGALVGGRATGLIAALLTAVAAPHVYYSQDARTYALLSLAGTAAVTGALLFCRTATGFGMRASTWLGLALYASCALIALYSHNTGFLLPLIANLAVIAWWLTASRRPAVLAAWLCTNLVVLAGWSWWLPAVLHQAGGTDSISWLSQPSLHWAFRDFTRLYGLRYLPWPPLAQLLPGCVVLATALLALWLRPGVETTALAAFTFGVPGFLFLLGLAQRPVWIERAFFWPLPLCLTLVAVTGTHLRPKAAAAALFGVVLLIELGDLGLFEARPQKEPYGSVVARIKAAQGPRDALLLVPETPIMSILLYGSRAGLAMPTYSTVPKTQAPRMGMPYDLLSQEPSFPGMPTFLRLDDLRRLTADHDRLWVLYRRRNVVDPQGKVATALRGTGRIVRDDRLPPFLELVLMETRSPPAHASP